MKNVKRFNHRRTILAVTLAWCICPSLIWSDEVTDPEKDSCESDKSLCQEEKNMEEGEIYWDLNGLKQDDPKLIGAIKDKVLIQPNGQPLNLIAQPSARRLGAQYGQPYDVEEVLKLKKSKKIKAKKKSQSGFFIEAGASCGEEISNTLYFEIAHGWTGLLVEPNPKFIKQLKEKNRNAWILPHCLSTKPEVEVVQFDSHFYNGGIIKEGKVRPSNLGRKGERDEKLLPLTTIRVQCFPLYSVLTALDNPHVDYFSLDIEGAEYVVLKTVPWNKVKIKLITVEMAHAGLIFPGGRDDIHLLLKENGYDFIKKTGIDDIFLRKAE